MPRPNDDDSADSCAVRADKWVYEVYGRRIADGSLLFWVERGEAPGQVWMHVSHSAVPVGLDPQTEFVAATEGGLNEVLQEIALATGWFGMEVMAPPSSVPTVAFAMRVAGRERM